jgi:hypothetical protein
LIIGVVSGALMRIKRTQLTLENSWQYTFKEYKKFHDEAKKSYNEIKEDPEKNIN